MLYVSLNEQRLDRKFDIVGYNGINQARAGDASDQLVAVYDVTSLEISTHVPMDYLFEYYTTQRCMKSNQTATNEQCSDLMIAACEMRSLQLTEDGHLHALTTSTVHCRAISCRYLTHVMSWMC